MPSKMSFTLNCFAGVADVAIGKIGSAEVDFIATTADDKKYIQVTESMMSEDVRNRELTPLQNIRDNYEKIVLSLEPGLDASYDGIRSEISWIGCSVNKRCISERSQINSAYSFMSRQKA